MAMTFDKQPEREYLLITMVVTAFAVDLLIPRTNILLALAAFLAVIPTLLSTAQAVMKRRINIDVFNTVAITISFVTGEIRSAGFIALMLTFARLLDWYTEFRTRNAMEELLKLKPLEAIRERDGKLKEVPVESVKKGDILIVKPGSRVPVDGIVMHGHSYVNEASVTGESALVEKIAGDRVLSSTLLESGVLRFRATRVGKDTTIERMAALMREAGQNKSHSEKLADRFAGIFLPLVGLFGLGTYLVTRDLIMTAALFLVACADDMAVAIPLAMTASLGHAAKRGVIIKGGEWLDVIGRVKTIILDKTGTLTYGSLAVKKVELMPGVNEFTFWNSLGCVEKFSEHPIGKTVYHEANRHIEKIPDPDEFRVEKGQGVWARHGKDIIVAGNAKIARTYSYDLGKQSDDDAFFYVFLNGKLAGYVTVSDIPRPEARKSIHDLYEAGIKDIVMFTGDHDKTAASIAKTLGITKYRAAMSPEEKLRTLEDMLRADGTVAMVGDGINDAPALARADVGIAMGGGGTAVATEAADIVILTDDLSRLPEMIELGRRTRSVVQADMLIWFVSNIFGFTLVLTGIAGPALAAFYNFATDFFPLINSSRLFHLKREV